MIKGNSVINGQFYKDGHFPIIPLWNSMVKILGATTLLCYI